MHILTVPHYPTYRAVTEPRAYKQVSFPILTSSALLRVH